MKQFLRFAGVGGLGFLVDAATLYLIAAAGGGWLVGRIGSYLAAATFTWGLNRHFTFTVSQRPSLAEWLRFLGANSLGGLTNYATYAMLYTHLPLVSAHPVLGVAAGSIAGLAINFGLSRRYVFREGPTFPPSITGDVCK